MQIKGFIFSLYALWTHLGTAYGSSNNNLFPLQSLYEWSVLKFATPSGYVPDPSYQPNNTYIIGLEEYEGRLFVMTPRQIDIPPATLSTIPAVKPAGASSSPLLRPYPSLSWNRMPTSDEDCSSTLVSVHQAQRDSCNNLWVLDSGVINVLNKAQRICLPKIVIFDLLTDQAVQTIEIPDSVLKPNSILENIALENVFQPSGAINTSCSYYVYLADTGAPGLVVLSPQYDIYRLSSPFMFPDPDYPVHKVNGQIYTEFGGIIGITIAGNGTNRELFFQPYSSTDIYSTLTSELQKYPYPGDPNDIPVKKRINKGSGGIGLKAINGGSILYNPESANSINIWNPQIGTSRPVAYNPFTIAVIFDIVPSSTSSNLYYLASIDFAKYVKRNVNTNVINQRVLILQVF